MSRLKKIGDFIKNNYKFLIIYAIICAICLCPLPFYLWTGGGTIDLKDRFEIDGEHLESGSLNLAYVREIRATGATYLLSYVMDWHREKISSYQINETENAEDIWKRERMYLQESIDNAIISAYNLAGEEIDIKSVYYRILSIDENSDTDLMVGDKIISVNGAKITEYDDIIAELKKSAVSSKLKIVVNRDSKEVTCYGKVMEADGSKKLGVYLIKQYEYTPSKKITVNFSNREGGSSGGFMLSLAIYNRLNDVDLTKGLKIVGTGTIDDKGQVGSIGGVKYKLKGAVSSHAQIFFAPAGENYEEAIKVKNEKKYDIEIVAVDNLKTAIDYLESRT